MREGERKGKNAASDFFYECTTSRSARDARARHFVRMARDQSECECFVSIKDERMRKKKNESETLKSGVLQVI